MLMAEEIIKTNIDGLAIRINKVIADARGVLCELSPKGFEDDFFSAGIRNLYASIPTQKGIARGGHYHFRQIENLYTLSGTLLWIFADMRPESKTKENVYSVIVGWSAPEESKGLQVFTIDKNQMAQILCPAGVYHIFAPLTDEKAIVIDASSTPYDKTDYVYPDISSLPQVKKILDDFGVKILQEPRS